MELRKGVGNPAELTIAFFDSVVDGTISDEAFARYVPALHEASPDLVQEIAIDIAEGLKQGAGQASFNDGKSCAGTCLKPRCAKPLHNPSSYGFWKVDRIREERRKVAKGSDERRR